MKLRVYATLLMAFTTLTSSVSPAQMQFGAGMYGGMQPCAGITTASGASDEDDETADLKADRAELRREKKLIEKDFRQLERDLDTLKDSITDVVQSKWVDLILPHMSNGANCGLCGTGGSEIVTQAPAPQPVPSVPTVTTPSRDTSTTIIVQTPKEVPLRPADPPKPKPDAPVRGPVLTPPTQVPKVEPKKPSTGKKVTGNDSKQSRMPAVAETVPTGASAKVSGGTPGSSGNSEMWPDVDVAGAQYAGAGSPLLCYNNEPPYSTRPWKAICRDGGKIDSVVCTNKFYQVAPDIKSNAANSCTRALSRYRRLTLEMDKSQKRLAKIDDEIDKITGQLKDIKMAERSNRDMEADGSGRRGESRQRSSRGPSMGQTLLSAGLALAPTLIGAYAGYRLGKEAAHDANEYNGKTGNQAVPVAPYVAQSMMAMAYPFGAGGMYGGVYGGVNGGMGCSPGIGGSMMGPMGGLGPMGVYGNMGGAFGYPNGMMGQYPGYGGGMYNTGGGPWGANGPWGVGQWPGGYPGYGNSFVSAIASAITGGYPGGGGGYPAGGGYPIGGVGYGAWSGAPFNGAQGSFPGGAGYGGFPGGYGGGGGGYPIGGGGGGGGYPISGGGYPIGGVGYGAIPGGVGYGGYPGGIGGGGGYPISGGGYPIGGYQGYQGGAGFAAGMDAQIAQRKAEYEASRLRDWSQYLQEVNSVNSKWGSIFNNGGGYTGSSTGLFDFRSSYTGTSSGPTTTTTTPGRTR